MAYIPRTALDERYVEAQPLLQDAIWHVDASVVKSDRLVDITGRGRDAIFGAGAAAPIVLPHTGQDYLWFPQRSDTINDTVYIVNSAATWNVATVTIWGDIQGRATVNGQFLQVGSNASNPWLVYVTTGRIPVSYRVGATTLTSAFPSPISKLWNRFTHTNSTGATLWEHSDDGITWTTIGTVNHGTCVASGDPTSYIGGGYAYAAAIGSRYQVDVVVDGTLVNQMIPSNHHTDYTRIKNTGSAGGNWIITRAATGPKLAFVDRPLLYFGSSVVQYAITMLPSILDGTCIIAVRHFADSAHIRLLLGANAALINSIYMYVNNGTSNIVNVCYVGADAGTRADITSTHGQHVYGSRLSRTAFNGIKDGIVVSTDSTVTTGATLIYDRILIGASAGPTYYEFLGAAIFDRVLTDTEVAKVSQELIDFGSGPWLTKQEATTKYVNVAGDTMIGPLKFNQGTVEVVNPGGHFMLKTPGRVSWYIFGDANSNKLIFVPSSSIDGTDWNWSVGSYIDSTGLVLPVDPVAAMNAATKQYVDTTRWKKSTVTPNSGTISAGTITAYTDGYIGILAFTAVTPSKALVNNDVLCTLPVGYRPAVEQWINPISTKNTFANAYVCSIGADGVIKMRGSTMPSTGESFYGAYVFLIT